MLKLKFSLYFALIFSTYFFQNLTSDFYSKFHQTDYKIEFQRIELFDYNRSFFNFVDLKTFKYNRTLTAINVTFNPKINMSTELEVVVQFYKFLSNEYRKLPGSRFEVNACRSIATNLAGIQIFFKCGNMTLCEIIQEITYHICNIYPDESRFPPFVPNGEYKFEFDLIYKDVIIVRAAAFLKIYRPISIPKNRKKIY